jgi:hypothetical protein
MARHQAAAGREESTDMESGSEYNPYVVAGSRMCVVL